MALKGLVIALLLLFPAAVYGQQEFAVQGTVKDSTGKPVDDVILQLFHAKDSAFAGYTISAKGHFDFSGLQEGSYFLKAVCLGYRDKIVSFSLPEDATLAIQLERQEGHTGEVEITGYRKSFSFKNGNIKATVENTPLAGIPDPVDILSKLPTVQVSGDRESVTVIGKGNPLIYLDNQRITLSDLSAISAADIRSIEIINHPSAKYDAEGRVVILITRKTNTQEGSRMDLSETASLKRYFENRAGLKAAFKKEKTEWKFGFQYNYINRWEGLQGNLYDSAHDYRSSFDVTSVGPRTQYLPGLGFYRQLKADGYFSVNVNGRIQEEPYTIKTNSYLAQAGTETNAFTSSANTSSRPFVNGSFNYLKNFAENKGQLFTGGQYSHYERNVANHILNTAAGNMSAEERQQRFSVDAAALRLDYEKTFPKGLKWESGGSANVARSATFFGMEQPALSVNTQTLYDYREDNEAVYTQVSGKLKKSEYTAGVRLENTVLAGGYRDSSQLLLEQKLFYFFPKMGISIPLDSVKTLSFNYARSTQRPDYGSANQITNYISPFFEWSNNLAIRPSISDEVSANLQIGNYSLGMSVNYTQQPAHFITEYDSTLQRLKMINKNLDAESGAGLTLTVPLEYKSFSSVNVLSVNISRVQDLRAPQNKVLPSCYFYSGNELKLPKDWTLSLGGWYLSKKRDGFFEDSPMFQVDFSVSKKISKKLNCTFNAFDIFRSLAYTESFHVNGIRAATAYGENQREFALAVRYSFGNLKDSRFRNKEVNENGNRLN